jgi:hypothetical protein
MIGKEVKVNLGSGVQFRHVGVFNIDKLYSELKGFMEDSGYDFNEDTHTEKEKSTGKNISIIWTFERDVTDYIKYVVDVKFLLQKIVPASENLVNGFIKMTAFGKVILDYKDEWSKNRFSEFMFKMYNNYIIKPQIEKHAKKLRGELDEFHSLAKEILDFHK